MKSSSGATSTLRGRSRTRGVLRACRSWAIGIALLACLGAKSLAAAPHTIDAQAQALGYDPITGLLYAVSASDGVGPLGDRLIAISPSTETVVASLDIGSGATTLAISPDAARAYVGYLVGRQVRAVDLYTMSPEAPFVVGTTDYVQDLAVMPGSPDTVAVALAGGGCGHVAVFHAGVEAAQNAEYACNTITFGDDPGILYAFNSYDTSSILARDAVSTNGVVVDTYLARGLPNFTQSIQARGGIVYSSSGVAVDGASLHPLGTYAASGPFAFDDADGVVAYFDGATVRVFDRETFVLLRQIPLHLPPFAHVVDASGCGANCVAAAVDSGQIVLVKTLADAVFSDGFDGAVNAWTEERP